MGRWFILPQNIRRKRKRDRLSSHYYYLAINLQTPQKVFDRFSVVIGDEAHQFKSKSLVSIMGKLGDAKYRFGFTGTLSGSQTHKWVLEGLFGPSYKIIKTDELMKKGHVAILRYKCIITQTSTKQI